MTLDDIGTGSLKLIVANVDRTIEGALRAHVPEHHIRPVGDAAWIIFTDAELPTIRDWLTDADNNPAAALVVEFEHWSGHGDIDQAWLLRRGH